MRSSTTPLFGVLRTCSEVSRISLSFLRTAFCRGVAPLLVVPVDTTTSCRLARVRPGSRGGAERAEDGVGQGPRRKIRRRAVA